jgi:hypothetical protein
LIHFAVKAGGRASDRIIELKKNLSEVEKEIIRQLKLDYFAESDQETSSSR